MSAPRLGSQLDGAPTDLGGPTVAVRGVRKRFGRSEVLRGIDLDVERGEVVCVLGPSGSGKSTLLRCINHLERLDGGTIRVEGRMIGYAEHGDHLRELPEKEIAKRRARCGMVFQRFNLFPHMTVMENLIEAPVGVLGEKKEAARAHAQDLLEAVGLGDRAGAYPRQLSGGQQQRVAIARALAMRPAVMLFDEPTSALDPELVGDVLDTMQRLAREGMTMVVVTHEISFAREVADRVVFMADGVVVEQGAPRQVLDAPAQKRTQDFLSRL